jgi:hypothetical protein
MRRWLGLTAVCGIFALSAMGCRCSHIAGVCDCVPGAGATASVAGHSPAVITTSHLEGSSTLPPPVEKMSRADE